MFAADESTVSNLQRLAAWAGRVSTKYKDTAKNLSNVKSAIRDIRQTSRPVTASDITTQEASLGMKDEIFGIPSSYVYAAAGLAIFGGIGYIIYNRVKK